MFNIIKSMVSSAYAQDQEASQGLIPCQDGTFADPSIGCTQAPGAIVNAQSDLLSIILKGASMVVTVVAIVSVAVLIYGGIVYALSMGNEDKLRKAKSVLFWSVFGLILSLLAKYIVMMILGLIR